MLYVLAMFVPPLALLLNGQLMSAIGNFILCVIIACLIPFGGLGLFFIWVPTILAWVSMAHAGADRREERMLKVIAKTSAAANKSAK